MCWRSLAISVLPVRSTASEIILTAIQAAQSAEAILRPPDFAWKRPLSCGPPLRSQVQCQASGSRPMRAGDGARRGPCERQLARHLEAAVGDEDDVVVAVDRGQQRGIVELALARIVAELEPRVRGDARAELLGRALQGGGERGVVGLGAFEQQDVAPFAGDEMLHAARRRAWRRSGSTCTISRAHSSRRSASSGAETLKARAGVPFSAAAAAGHGLAGRSSRNSAMPPSARAVGDRLGELVRATS